MTKNSELRFIHLLDEILKIDNITFREEAIEWLKGEYLDSGNVPFIEANESDYYLEDFFCEISVIDDYFEKYVFEDDDNSKETLIHRLKNDAFFESVIIK